ncbi:hypothetical protein RN09_3414 [Mycobacterium tuberculosis variant africanum]|nr:hypothetical protein RN09_3414 [Mycobacterium tuberculosis variant africanum]
MSNGGGNLAATVGRQTQNPRGDGNMGYLLPAREMLSEVVRPKTPRGDGNFVDHHCHSSPHVSSDPKPERGRKLAPTLSV